MQWQVPLFDPDLGKPEIDALTDVIHSKWLTLGERTAEFERRFAQAIDCREAIAVNSCTAALHLALKAVGVQPGDDVICPALTFVASANAIRYCGARPVFADVASLDDWNVSADTIARVLTARTRAIVVVHYAGYVCDMEPIMALARSRGLAVVEDVAHAPGASRDGISAGARGDVGCFSFFSNKNMTTGEGGMVTTRRDDIARYVRQARSHGMTSVTLDRHKGHAYSYDVVDLGYNYRMSELNAALGLVQLEQLKARNARRGVLVDHYRARLQDIEGLSVPFTANPGTPAYHIMPILLPGGIDRGKIMASLRDAGIQTSIHYHPVDTFSDYQKAGLGPCEYLFYTHDIGHRTLTLPLFPALSIEQIDAVCTNLRLLLNC